MAIALVGALSCARPALAQPPVATEAPAPAPPASVVDPSGATAKKALFVSGNIVMGLGAATLLAAGVTWLVGATSAATLRTECPNHLCVEGTTGGDAYVTARDALHGADVLVGVGAPVLGAGLVMLMFSSAVGPRGSAVRAAPIVTARGGGASVELRF